MASWFGRVEHSCARPGLPFANDRFHLPFWRRSCSGRLQVEGEIFEIPDAQGLGLLDALEGNGSFYQRRLDDYRIDSPKKHTAWVYYIIREMDGEARRNFSV